MHQDRFSLQVETQPATGDPQPQRFRLWGGMVHVEEVIDRWPSDARAYFKVRGDDGGIYIIGYSVPHRSWDLQAYQARPEI
ncbi:MAG: hypothetical protein SV583_11850 [Pseudomonadota bacterium]|nr:hypothetical protein [Pseudomonadota bacterium]